MPAHPCARLGRVSQLSPTGTLEPATVVTSLPCPRALLGKISRLGPTRALGRWRSETFPPHPSALLGRVSRLSPGRAPEPRGRPLKREGGQVCLCLSAVLAAARAPVPAPFQRQPSTPAGPHRGRALGGSSHQPPSLYIRWDADHIKWLHSHFFETSPPPTRGGRGGVEHFKPPFQALHSQPTANRALELMIFRLFLRTALPSAPLAAYHV